MGKKSKKSKISLTKSMDTSSNSEEIHSEANEKSKVRSPKSISVQSEKANSSKEKKIWSFKDLVEAMKPSIKELEFRKKKSKESGLLNVYSKLFRCTKCHRNFKINSEKCEEVQMHPCLGVLMCNECCNYYGDGEFSLDSENEDKYCRWCGEGGTLFGCSRCICGFCVTCIKKHFGNEYLKKVEKDDDWLCFFCNPKPLWNERYICSLAMQMYRHKVSAPSSKSENGKKGLENHENSKLKTKNSEKNEHSRVIFEKELKDDSSSSVESEEWSCKSLLRNNEDGSRKRFYSTSSEESEIGLPEKNLKKMRFSSQQLEGSCQTKDSFENLKQVVLEKLEKVIKLSEYQLAFGVKWSSKVLKKLADPKHIKTPEDLREECQKIKWFLSALSTYLLEFCNSVDSAEKSLSHEDGLKDSNNFPQPATDPTSFATIIKFLSFVTNQVNTFVKKGFSLTDVLEAEIHDDSKFIGIKKVSKPSSSISSGSSSSTLSETAKTDFHKNNTSTQLSTEMEELKDDKDESPDEDSLKLVVDQGSEVQEGDSESTDLNSSSAAVRDTRKDILQILQILEHA